MHLLLWFLKEGLDQEEIKMAKLSYMNKDVRLKLKTILRKKTVVNLEDDQKMRFSWALIKKNKVEHSL